MDDLDDGPGPTAPQPQQPPQQPTRPGAKPKAKHARGPRHEERTERPPSREALTRAAEERPNATFLAPNQVLQAPRLRHPAGKTFRWEVEFVRGQKVQAPVQQAIMGGYLPVRYEDLADDCPYRLGMEVLGSQDGILRHGGLVGMMIKDEILHRRRAITQREVDANTSAVNRMHAIQDDVRQTTVGRLPTEIVQDQSRVEFGQAAYRNL